MDYLEKIQNSSGGFYGSYGKGAKYFPKEEISWAVKYFIDAYLLKIKTDFDQEVNIYSEEIAENDGRVQSILSCFGGLTGKKVIDVGCGKGRYLRILQNRFPESRLYGIDLSEEMLKSCPEGVETSVGSMLNIRYPNAFFDCVYSVEALEHAVAIEPAIKEMARILKPGGKIVIIDKNAAKLGVFE
jgi:malonyl-CoA O-methyltransferase